MSPLNIKKQKHFCASAFLYPIFMHLPPRFPALFILPFILFYRQPLPKTPAACAPSACSSFYRQPLPKTPAACAPLFTGSLSQNSRCLCSLIYWQPLPKLPLPVFPVLNFNMHSLLIRRAFCIYSFLTFNIRHIINSAYYKIFT